MQTLQNTTPLIAENFAYGFRKTNQREDNILISRDCSEPDTFMQFQGYTLLKAQYAALEEFCGQYNETPEQMFSEHDNLEIENGLVIRINVLYKYIHTEDKKLTIPKNLEYLQELWCHDNRLSAISELPRRLQRFYCMCNELSFLPELPRQLRELICAHNKLSILPELPEKLQRIYCINNQLIALPKLPQQLQELECNNNILRTLPELPKNLQKLRCSNNRYLTLTAPIELLAGLADFAYFYIANEKYIREQIALFKGEK